MSGLEIKDLSFSYPGSSLLFRGLSLSVPQGCVSAVSGANGSGKTTLSRIISGLLPVTTGSVLLDGKKEFRPACAFEELNAQLLYENIREELNFFTRYSETSRGLSPEDIAVKYGFSGLLDKKSQDLSNGEKQSYIISVSSAFSREKLLVIDEPTAFLDDRTCGALAKLILKMKGEGYSILVLGHFFKGLDGVIDSFYRLENGTLKKEKVLPSRPQLSFKKRKRGGLLLEVEGLNFAAGDREILSGISMKIFSGRIKAVCGGNGCGKTTLAKILAGVKEGHTGRILVQGRPASSRDLRRACFLVLSNPLNQLLSPTVSGNLRSFGISLDDARKKLERLNLWKKLDSPVSWLSYGEMQKLLMLCATARKAPLLLVDEPLLSLDLEGEKNVFEMLDEYALAGGAVFLVSHNEELVRGLCDEIYYLENGREEDLGN